MLRKIAHTIFVFTLLFATGGFTLSKHYCGQKIVSFAVNAEAKTCSDSDMGDCCHHETDHFQLKEEFVSNPATINFENDFYIQLALAPVIILNLEPQAQIERQTRFYSDVSPPPNIHTALAKLQIYLL